MNFNLVYILTTKQLADYLHYLDKNDTEYRRYFDWRLQSPDFVSLMSTSHNIGYQPWCNLCRKLMLLNHTRSSAITTYYQDIYSCWYKDSNCKNSIF